MSRQRDTLLLSGLIKDVIVDASGLENKEAQVARNKLDDQKVAQEVANVLFGVEPGNIVIVPELILNNSNNLNNRDLIRLLNLMEVDKMLKMLNQEKIEKILKILDKCSTNDIISYIKANEFPLKYTEVDINKTYGNVKDAFKDKCGISLEDFKDMLTISGYTQVSLVEENVSGILKESPKLFSEALGLTDNEKNNAKQTVKSPENRLLLANKLSGEVTDILLNPDLNKNEKISEIKRLDPEIKEEIKEALSNCVCKDFVVDIITDYPDKIVDDSIVNKYFDTAVNKFKSCKIDNLDTYRICLLKEGFIIKDKLVINLKNDNFFYKKDDQVLNAYNYYDEIPSINRKVLIDNTIYPSQIRSSRDKIIYLYLEKLAQNVLASAIKFFNDFNIDYKDYDEWYAENDLNFKYMLSDAQKMSYIYTSELAAQMKTNLEIESFFEKNEEIYTKLLDEHNTDEKYISIILNKKLNDEYKVLAVKNYLYNEYIQEISKHESSKALKYSKSLKHYIDIEINKEQNSKTSENDSVNRFFKSYRDKYNGYNELIKYLTDTFLLQYEVDEERLQQLYKIVNRYLKPMSKSDIEKMDKYFVDTSNQVKMTLLDNYKNNPMIRAIAIAELSPEVKEQNSKFFIYEDMTSKLPSIKEEQLIAKIELEPINCDCEYILAVAEKQYPSHVMSDEDTSLMFRMFNAKCMTWSYDLFKKCLLEHGYIINPNKRDLERVNFAEKLLAIPPQLKAQVLNVNATDVVTETSANEKIVDSYFITPPTASFWRKLAMLGVSGFAALVLYSGKEDLNTSNPWEANYMTSPNPSFPYPETKMDTYLMVFNELQTPSPYTYEKSPIIQSTNPGETVAGRELDYVPSVFEVPVNKQVALYNPATTPSGLEFQENDKVPEGIIKFNLKPDVIGQTEFDRQFYTAPGSESGKQVSAFPYNV